VLNKNILLEAEVDGYFLVLSRFYVGSQFNKFEQGLKRASNLPNGKPNKYLSSDNPSKNTFDEHNPVHIHPTPP